MTSIFVILLLSVGAFFVGGIPFGLIIARLLAHEDIRSVGSGNIGTTNVARSAGSMAGVLTLGLLKRLRGASRPVFCGGWRIGCA